MTRKRLASICALWLPLIGFAADDILIADFEREDYGEWNVAGDAFGTAPAKGTLPGQMTVTGFRGSRLVNTFFNGDDATGTLTSPPFIIERKYINFLIGGGRYPGETCMNLLVDGTVVRTASGYNDRPGGSEALRWQRWDVSELAGKQGVIQIVDERTGGWGHINIDHIVQTEEPYVMERTMQIDVEKQYLNFPVKTGQPKKWARLLRGGEVVREFEIELAEEKPAFWVFLDLGPFKGEQLTLQVDDVERGSRILEGIVQSDHLVGAEDLYNEKHRPQFHFSSRRGWNNDPNGLVYYAGEYHLFYQHNPFGWNWGNMTWGHAVSHDLVHWTELGDAIHPDRLGTIFSGSAVVDVNNTTGFQTGDEKPLVCIYTSAGGTSRWSEGQPFTQSIAYSNDRGRTWTVYEGNPVQGHVNGSNRDPKVIWHEASSQWVIVLYLDDNRMGFYTSKDLKSWAFQSELTCFHECPELFLLPVDGDDANTKWVLYGASGDYFLGDFDGKTYTPEREAIRFNHGNCFYASQTFNNMPTQDGRRIQIAWGQVGHHEMPFNQMMLFPVELTLRTTDQGVRLCAAPVRELEGIRGPQYSWAKESLKPGENLLADMAGDLFDIRAEFKVRGARELGFVVRGTPVVYDVAKQEVRCKRKAAIVKPIDDVIRLRLLVDRMSIEIFANDGQVYMPMGIQFDDGDRSLEVFARGGAATVNSLDVAPLRSAWGPAK